MHRVTANQPFTLDAEQILPGFDIEQLPFVVCNATAHSDTIDLLNVKTGKIAPLIKVSAQNLQYQQALFFTPNGNGEFTLAFCSTQSSDDGTLTHSWHEMDFHGDFTTTLAKHGQLPITSTSTQLGKLSDYDRLVTESKVLNAKMTQVERELLKQSNENILQRHDYAR